MNPLGTNHNGDKVYGPEEPRFSIQQLREKADKFSEWTTVDDPFNPYAFLDWLAEQEARE